MRRTIEILGLNGNAAVGRLSVNLPMGLDYIHYDWFVSGGAAVASADITEIRETINSDIIRQVTGTQQDAMNQYDRMQAFGGSVLRLPCELMGMKDVAPTYSTTRNTLSVDPETGKSISQIRLELVQATATTWRVFAEVDDATTGGPGGIERVLVYTDSVGGAAEASSQGKISFGQPERRYFRRAFQTVSAGNLNGDMRVLQGVGQQEIFKRPKALNDRISLDYVRTPANFGGASTYVLDTTETGIPEMFDTMVPVVAGQSDGDAVKMGGQLVRNAGIFDLRPFPSAAGTLTSIISTVGRL